MVKTEKTEATPSSVFLSYAQDDHHIAEALELGLCTQSVSVWRDKTSLYAGVKWPKALGEAILEADALVLLWSAAASSSEFVELEWNLALALKKPILIVLSDETEMPVSLRAIVGIKEGDLGRILERLVGALKRQETSIPETKSMQMATIAQLNSLPQREPGKLLEGFKAFQQLREWKVGGAVYQAVGNINIHAHETVTEIPLNRWKIWGWIGVGASIATLLARQFPFNTQMPETTRSGPLPLTQATERKAKYITGIVRDEKDNPVDGASVELMGTQLSTVTKNGGHFSLLVPESSKSAHLSVTRNGFPSFKEHYPVREGVNVVLPKP